MGEKERPTRTGGIGSARKDSGRTLLGSVHQLKGHTYAELEGSGYIDTRMVVYRKVLTMPIWTKYNIRNQEYNSVLYNMLETADAPIDPDTKRALAQKPPLGGFWDMGM